MLQEHASGYSILAESISESLPVRRKRATHCAHHTEPATFLPEPGFFPLAAFFASVLGLQ